MKEESRGFSDIEFASDLDQSRAGEWWFQREGARGTGESA